MQIKYLLALGAAALFTGVAVSGKIGLGAAPENVSLVAASGQELASDLDVVLVDIRTPQEWKTTGVIKGALLVTYSDPESFLAAVRPKMKEGQKLALICRSGNRTSRAASQLAAKFDGEIIDVAGGMSRVLSEGYKPVAPKL